MSKKTIDLYNSFSVREALEEAERARKADDEPPAPYREPWGRPQLLTVHGPVPRPERQHAPSPDYSTAEPCSCDESLALRKQLEASQARAFRYGEANQKLQLRVDVLEQTLLTIGRLLREHDAKSKR